MKLLLTVITMMFLSTSFGQLESGNTVYFGQCMFDIQDQQSMQELQNNIRNNPDIEMVRLDFNSQRALIVTMGLNSLSENDFRSLFEAFGEDLTCIQIGVYQVDEMNPYPFTNCN